MRQGLATVYFRYLRRLESRKHLQMSLQRQYCLVSCFKTMGVGVARVFKPMTFHTVGGLQPPSSPHLLLTLKHHLWVNLEIANFFSFISSSHIFNFSER